MFTVYVAVASDLEQAIVAEIKGRPDLVLLGTAHDAFTAIRACRQAHPGVLILDDALLANASADALASLANAPYPIILLAGADGPAVAKRALTIGAQDLVDRAEWRQELLPSLERVARPLAGDKREGRVISVFSSKGGVGKTMLSANLAVSLADKVHDPVVIVDLDLTFGDIAALFGATPKTTIRDLMTAPLTLQAVMGALTEVLPQVFVLAAPRTPEEVEDIRAEALVPVFQWLRQAFHYVIVDLSPGYDQINVTTLDLSDVVLVITTPDVVTLRAVSQSLRLFRQGFHYDEQKVRLVLNRSGSRTGITVQDVAATLKQPVLYELPTEGNLPARAANQGVPLLRLEPESSLAVAIGDLASRLIQEESGRRPKRRGPRAWFESFTRRHR
ncbi:MAG: P-loop NTPase [Firmicutes bacterium]|nr:P-loop NTPase [Bacillota bacterium]